jgi:uncharacterized repeat protein (TIGR03803 family)
MGTTDARNVSCTRRATWCKRISALILLAAGTGASIHAQTFTVLYTFTGGADGGFPQYGRLIADPAGNLYGTATWGGDVDCPTPPAAFVPGPGCGVVFKLDPNTREETALYTFSGGADGSSPWSGLIRGIDGNLYGTTAFGGFYGAGVIFKVDMSGHESVLHSFSYADGAYPTGDLIKDCTGALYGTTVAGGNLQECSTGPGCGTIFKEQPQSGKFEVLHRFTAVGSLAIRGANPTHALTRDRAGNIYGTTENGGRLDSYCQSDESHEAVDTGFGGCGAIFKLGPAGKETLLYLFNSPPDGSDPRAKLNEDAAGNLYGTTFSGGLYGNGTVFKLDNRNHQTVLYNFHGSPDGANPWGGLVRDAAGNLYGTTNHGESGVFKLDPMGNLTVLHTFRDSDGLFPEAPLLLHASTLYGITSGGGTLSDGRGGTGTVFKITLP